MTEHSKAVRCDTAILIPPTVEDLDGFVSAPERYLCRIGEEPVVAAQLWHERLKRNPYGGDGLVSVAYYGHDLINPALWDDVSGIWEALLECVEAYRAGDKERVAVLSGQPVELTLRQVPAGALFTVDGVTTLVDPEVFIPGLLDGAAAFSRWVSEYLGTNDAPTAERIDRLR